MRDRLHDLTTNALITALPESLKAALDAALSKGATRDELWHRFRGRATGLVRTGIHAYLYPEKKEIDR